MMIRCSPPGGVTVDPTTGPDGPPPGADAVRRLRVVFIGHATVLLEWGGVRVLTDPFLRRRLGPLIRHGPMPDPVHVDDLDVVLVSHGHPDHFDPASLAAIPGRPTIVVPRGLGTAVARAARGDVIELVEGDQAVVGDVVVRAVHASHWISPGAPRARPLGYLLETGPRIYFAGDTARSASMLDLAGYVDLALLPVGSWGPHLGPGHMGPRSAAEALADIRPRVAVPIHWGTLYPAQLHRAWRGPLRDPGDRFSAHAARLAPGVEVRVLRPGAATWIGD